MSSFFRRPGEDSSEDSSESEGISDVEISRGSIENENEDEVELAPTESLSTNASLPKDEDDDQTVPAGVTQQQKEMMFATLLEEWCKTRAAELMNAALGDSSNKFHRLSPEVQDLAQKLYADAGDTLATSGVLPPAATSRDHQPVRQQYLAGLDGISLRSLEEKDLLPPSSMKQLPMGAASNTLALVRTDRRGSGILSITNEPVSSMIMQTGRLSVSSPHSDMALKYTRAPHSHYEASFQQMKLLGKGGFGRVYHAFNVFDRKEYAVKKIPLSKRLSQKYRESGHQELESVLREVQSLAELEHPNIVRYHATWIEEPKSHPSPITSPPAPQHSRPIPINRPSAQKLLDITPYKSPPNDRLTPHARNKSLERSDGIIFSHSEAPSRRTSHEASIIANGWSHSSHYHRDSSLVRESDLFTDGQHQPHSSSPSSDSTSIDSTVYVLHVQMSLYPMTLAQYLSPPSTTTSSTTTTISTISTPPSPNTPTPPRRHCFHLIPALKIILGILCGLQYIHSKGLVHRDIKPGNIFLSTLSGGSANLIPEGFHDVGTCVSCGPYSSPQFLNPRIGDFGLVAERVQAAVGEAGGGGGGGVVVDGGSWIEGGGTGKVVGTEFYRPPPWPSSNEGQSKSGTLVVATAQAIDEKLDVFALGVILVEMLYPCSTSSERMHVLRDLQKGRLPKGLMARVDGEEGYGGSGLGERVEEGIKRMIDGHPERRWGCQRVRDFIEGVIADVISDRTDEA